MANTETKLFISDIGLAALLLTLKFELVDLKRANEKRVCFVFAISNGIEEVVDGFWQDKLVKVQTQTLFHNFRNLKNRLHSIN